MAKADPLKDPAEKRAKLMKIVRVINVSVASAIIVFSVLSFVFLFVHFITSLEFFLLLSPLFMAFFGVCILASQFKVRFILKRVPFLKSMLGKGLFYLYLSSVIFYFFYVVDEKVLAWAGAISLFCSGLLFLALHFGCGKSEGAADMEEQDEQTYKERLV